MTRDICRQRFRVLSGRGIPGTFVENAAGRAIIKAHIPGTFVDNAARRATLRNDGRCWCLSACTGALNKSHLSDSVRRNTRDIIRRTRISDTRSGGPCGPNGSGRGCRTRGVKQEDCANRAWAGTRQVLVDPRGRGIVTQRAKQVTSASIEHKPSLHITARRPRD